MSLSGGPASVGLREDSGQDRSVARYTIELIEGFSPGARVFIGLVNAEGNDTEFVNVFLDGTQLGIFDRLGDDADVILEVDVGSFSSSFELSLQNDGEDFTVLYRVDGAAEESLPAFPLPEYVDNAELVLGGSAFDAGDFGEARIERFVECSPN